MSTKNEFVDYQGNSIEDNLCVEEDSHGLMCPEDKIKLDGIEEGANKYTHPTYTVRTSQPLGDQTPDFGDVVNVAQVKTNGTGHVTETPGRKITIPSTLSNGTGTAGLIKTSSTVINNSGYTACPVISGVPYYKDTTYSLSSFGITATAAELNKLDGCTATTTELNYIDGVTDNIQTQLDNLEETCVEIMQGTVNLSNSMNTKITNLENSLDGYMDLTSDQTTSGVKTFSNGFKLGNATFTFNNDDNAVVIAFD